MFGNEDYDIVLFFRRWYNFVMGYIELFFTILQNYGWQIVFFSIILYYAYKKMIKPTLERLFGSYEEYKKVREENEYAAKYHKNPDLFAERISAQQSYAQKLQEKYERDLEDYKMKQEEKLAKKHEEVLIEMEKNSNGGGKKLGNGSRDQKNGSKSFKPDYNPLMGAGSSSSYRPPKRSACSRGGCG